MGNTIVEQIKDRADKDNFVSRRKLGELLIESGLLTNEKLREALQTQKTSGK
jgi:hypothetical protein